MRKSLALTVFLVCLMIVLASCGSESSGPAEPYEILADQVNDYWFEKVGGQEKQLSYLPGFNEKDISYWKALLKYGEFHTSAASQLGKTRIVFFISIDTFVPPDENGNFNSDIHSKVFASYAGYSNGNQLFSINPFGTFDDSFFEIYRQNIPQLKGVFSGVE